MKFWVLPKDKFHTDDVTEIEADSVNELIDILGDIHERKCKLPSSLKVFNMTTNERFMLHI